MTSGIKIKVAEESTKRGIVNAYQLQKAMESSPAMAARLWRGDFKMIGISTLNKLCEVLNCQPGQLFTYVSDSDKVK